MRSPRGGTCVKGMVCGSICESLKLAPQVHLAALGCDWPHCLLTGKSVWTPNTSMNFFMPQCSVSLGTVILVIKFFCELGNVCLVFLHSAWYTVSIQQMGITKNDTPFAFIGRMGEIKIKKK